MMVLGADTHKRSHTIAAVAGGDRRSRWREDRRGRGARVRRAADLGARTRPRAGLGAGGLPACRRLAGAVSDRPRRAGAARPDQADGRLAARGPDARQVRQHRRGRGRPGRAARRPRRRCRPRIWTGPSSTCGCSSITASAWSANASRSTTRSNGTCTICGPNSSCPAARCSRPSGAPGSAGSLARAEQTMRVRIARDELRRLRELTHSIRALESRDRPARRRGRPAAALRARLRAAHRRQARRRDRRRRPLRHRRQARPRRRARPDPGQLRQDQPPPARPRRQPPDQRRHPSDRDHPRPLPPRDPRLHRPQALRRQDPPRRHPLASSATSPAASGTSCNRPRPSRTRRSHPLL